MNEHKQWHGKLVNKILWLSLIMLFIAKITVAQNNNHQKVSIQPATPKLNLLIFSGSDWCLPCIRFDREVLQDPAFKTFSTEHLLVEIADFPQHQKLSNEEVRQNEILAEKYNPQGYFPHVLLLDEKGKILTQIITNKTDVEQVIAQIRSYLSPNELEEFTASLLLMGNSFQITIVTEKNKGMAYLAESINEIQNIESWLSSWQEGSVTTRLNNEAAKHPIQVPDDYFRLIQRCLGLSELTQGAFDISFNGLGELYEFDQQEHDLPDETELDQRLMHVGFDKIEIHDNKRISFSDSLVKIGFGAIGKGYAAEQVKQLMQSRGVPGGVINASGDLTAWGTDANGEVWKIGIPEPRAQDNIILWLPIKDKAIATSGDYEKYFMYKGQRYSHIINPKTGLPVVGSSSVSVVSSSAELSDALATAVSVMGLEIGMNMINQLAGVECVFIDNNRKLHFSDGLQAYAY